MSIDNSELLMLLGGTSKRIDKQTIGIAGQQGFGVGIYGGDPSDLTTMGLTPMKGCDNPTHENYGNYIHTNTSIMVYIPAFCYRIGNSSAPSYSRDGANALEIRDALELGMPRGKSSSSWTPPDGWILHRAFIDGGKLKSGFFVDKYLCSKWDKDPSVAVSVKGGDQISLGGDTKKYVTSYQMLPECEGRLKDVFPLARARGTPYACISAFQWSALSMLSLAHGQASTTSKTCAWFDPNNITNFPKGCTDRNNRRDIDDPSVVYSPQDKYKYYPKTGSGVPFAKTTHNGMSCGVSDVSGCMMQPLLGILIASDSVVCVALDTCKMQEFTNTTHIDANEYFSSIQYAYNTSNTKWGKDSYSAFFSSTKGIYRALCGVIPPSNCRSSSGMNLFGNDNAYLYLSGGKPHALVASYPDNLNATTSAGIWCRYTHGGEWRYGSDELAGFRIAGYAN